MSVYIFGFLLIVILAAYFVWRRGKKPFKHRNISQDDLKKFLEVLLYRGYDKGFACIEIPKDKKFLQVTKYIAGKDLVGLQFDFPLAIWSKDYYELLKTTLKERDIRFKIQETKNQEVPEFLVIDVKQDLELAMNLIKLIFQSVYKLDQNQRLDVYFENVSPKSERIGF